MLNNYLLKFGLLLVALTIIGDQILAQSAPVLPDQSFDYVSYAVTNLPEYYRISPPFSDAGASDNTPIDNPITNSGATLGRVLFYDTRLSINNTISCASCHSQATGFGDRRRLSVGHNGLPTNRHSMTLVNAKFYFSGLFRWDESAATLETQCLIPIEAEDEMGLPLGELRERLANVPFYDQLFSDAFGDSAVTDDRIAKAMAQFIRSMVSYNSKYDEAFLVGSNGFPDFESVFTPSELLGQRLFERTPDSVGCHECHRSQAQIGDIARNIGLDLKTIDQGAGEGRFKVTSLRNVEFRGRFMHDGRFSTLEEVVEFYDSGIQMHPNVDPLLTDNFPLNLSAQEKQGLVDFMKTLTDPQFLTSPLFSDPFNIRLGDVNLDGVVSIADVAPFVDLLVSQNYQQEADTNLDTRVNLLDVAPFVDLIIGK